ncbi:MAG: adenosine deaminase [Chloroflexi bacterium]|nr:adenosine deaminase [Chloroflexota bacterium]MBU1750333.1 adenosine deaminase [Chloroflexota bacterium]MBU1877966.1 adenosine deaminase [Chloroflexota bacterium]
MDLYDIIAAMPKVELHVHLEGSIRPQTLLELARRNAVALPAHDEASLHEFYRFRDFDHFIQVYLTIIGCLKTPDDYRLIAYEFGADMARQHIRYAEVTFTPETNIRANGLSFDVILAALNDGRAQAYRDFGVRFQWVLDISRNLRETAVPVARWAVEAQDRGVVALGLGGPEVGHPPELYAEAFDYARAAGLHCVPHAGELGGPPSVWGAIRALHAERIGHGVRSIEDPALVAYLHEHHLPIEVCPTSNLCLGIYPSYEAHPFRRLWEAGVYITVNSDDPPLFNTNLVREYTVLADHMGFSAADLGQLSLNALHASFLPADEKTRLEAEFLDELSRLQSTIEHDA